MLNGWYNYQYICSFLFLGLVAMMMSVMRGRMMSYSTIPRPTPRILNLLVATFITISCVNNRINHSPKATAPIIHWPDVTPYAMQHISKRYTNPRVKGSMPMRNLLRVLYRLDTLRCRRVWWNHSCQVYLGGDQVRESGLHTTLVLVRVATLLTNKSSSPARVFSNPWNPLWAKKVSLR